MIVYSFDILCEGRAVLRGGRMCIGATFSAGPCEKLNEPVNGIGDQWAIARARGWRIVKHSGKDHHLCPRCAQAFLEREEKK